MLGGGWIGQIVVASVVRTLDLPLQRAVPIIRPYTAVKSSLHLTWWDLQFLKNHKQNTKHMFTDKIYNVHFTYNICNIPIIDLACTSTTLISV